MISARKALRRAQGSNHRTNFMKYANKRVNEACINSETQIRLTLRSGIYFPGQYEIKHLIDKGYDLDWDESQLWIELKWKLK